MLNPTNSNDFKPTSNNKAYAFSRILKDNGINSFIRFSEGKDISAACGQLAYKEIG